MKTSVLLVVSLVLAALAGPAAGFQLFGLSEEQEIELGKEAAKEIEKQEPVLDDRRVTRYLDELGQRLVRHSGRSDIPYHFKVVNREEINAFALPGGYVYVNRGLIEAADNESELAGVIAHEIGHVVARHGVEQLQRAQLTGLGLTLLDAILGGGTGGKIANVAAQMVATGAFMKYSRDQEREADRLGARNLYDAGYDPRGMVTLFEKLAELRERRPNLLDRFFGSHPNPDERAQNVGGIIDELGSLDGLKKDDPELHRIQERLKGIPPVERR